MVAVSIAMAVGIVASGLIAVAGWNFGNIGIVTPSDLTTISVQPGSPAERAGVRNGDTIDFARTSLHDRLAVLESSAVAGKPLTLAVLRGHTPLTFTYVLEPIPRTYVALAGRVIPLIMTAFVFVLVAMVLLRVPSGDAVALWLFSIIWTSGEIQFIEVLGNDVFTAAMTVYGDVVALGVGLAGAMLLALRAGGSPNHGRRHEWIALPVGVVVAVTFVMTDSAVALNGYLPPEWLQRVVATYAPFYLVYAACAAIVIRATVGSSGAARVRRQWFAFGFTCWLVANVFAFAARLPAFAFTDWMALLIPISVFAAGQLMFAYPIVRQDLFGIGFVLNRAAIYAVVTAFIVGFFAGGNWLIGSALKSSGLALPVDVVLAAVVGLSLNAVQRRVNRVVDRVFFRRRYAAATRLRRVARALSHPTDTASIAQAIALEPYEALGITSAAYFARSDSGSFEFVAGRGWPPGAATALDAKSRFVLHLTGADERALPADELPQPDEFPTGLLRPRTVIPLWSRRELVGIAFYGAHVNGATLDPEEIEEIERVTSAASAAFDRVAALELVRVREELYAARAEIARLSVHDTNASSWPV